MRGVTTRKGTYSMDLVVVSHQSTAMTEVQSKTTSVWYFHPDVKFGLVRQHNIMNTDVSIVDIVAFINNISPASLISRSLNSYIIEKSRHHTFSSRMDLVDSNQAKVSWKEAANDTNLWQPLSPGMPALQQ